MIALVTNGFFQRSEHGASMASMKTIFMAAAISPVAPVVNKGYQAGESTNSVFYGELMAVWVPDSRLWEVSNEPVGTVEGFPEYLKFRSLRGHISDECRDESWEVHR